MKWLGVWDELRNWMVSAGDVNGPATGLARPQRTRLRADSVNAIRELLMDLGARIRDVRARPERRDVPESG
jgi:hypothetical protein